MSKPALAENYKALAAVIVECACREYIGARRTLSRSNRKARREMAEADIRALYRFFMSDWFGMLCDVDPERLISMLNEEADEGTRTFWVPSRS